MQYFLPTFKLEKPSISKSLIKSLYWALTFPGCKIIKTTLKITFQNIESLRLNSENKAALAKVAESLVGSDDKSLSNTAREVLKICKS